MAACLNNLASNYVRQRAYAQAEPLYLRALAVWEAALGSDDPNVATALEGYAAMLRQSGRGKQARPLAERARAIREREASANLAAHWVDARDPRATRRSLLTAGQ